MGLWEAATTTATLAKTPDPADEWPLVFNRARTKSCPMTSALPPAPDFGTALTVAAAPEVLDTLERFVTACHAHLPESTDQAFCGLYASARVAIAKATATP